MTQMRKDYLGAVIIGIVAAALSKILFVNLNINFPYYIFAIVIFVACPAGIFFAELLKEKMLSLYQFIKFGETGGLNTFVDLGILNLLIFLTGYTTGMYYSAFKAISFLVAVTNSYFWNKFWVFQSNEKKKTTEEAVKFYVVSAVGFVINVAVASLVVRVGVGNLSENLLANVGAALAFIVTMMFNFFGYKLFVFKKAK